jgi:predicted Abi (CAAX) family protease
VGEEDVEQINWLDGNPNNITKEQILTRQAELIAEYDANKHQRDRQAEYPAIADQLDKIYHDGIDSWKEEMILPVKNKFPKT